MLILITMFEKDPKTHQENLVVSHGIDERTGKNVCLPGEHPSKLGGVYSEDLREWVIYDYPAPQTEETALVAPQKSVPENTEKRDDWFSQEYDAPSM